MNIEITIRDIRHLDEIISKIQELGPAQVNVTDKNGLTDNVLLIESMKELLPTVHFVPHYSFKNHTSKDKEKIVENYYSFLGEASSHGITETMLISGSPRPKIDTLVGLELAQDFFVDHASTDISFAVAYNPFLSDDELVLEQHRLREKLKSPLVKRVYLQMGSLLKPLKNGIEFVRSINPEIIVTPSIVIPDKNFLRKFRFRPWRGVIIDDKYLANTKNAIAKTKELLAVASDSNTDPLLEMVGFQHFKVSEFKEEFHDIL